mmetsp:Transcript_57941/g.154878  ORF Transcript_57941/g.154878 Transcript_57941/m.154878 type:complete len:221 (-) Transcript_57941:1638-2300(-)
MRVFARSIVYILRWKSHARKPTQETVHYALRGGGCEDSIMATLLPPTDTGLPSSRELRGRRKRPQRAAQRRRQPTRSRPRPRLRRRVTPSTARGCSKPSLGRGGATSLRRGPHAAALPGAEHHPHRAPPLVDDGLLVLVATAAHGEGHLHLSVHRERDRAVHLARPAAQHLHDHRAVAAQPPMIAGTGEVAFHRLAEVQPVRHRLFAPHALPLLAVQLCL